MTFEDESLGANFKRKRSLPSKLIQSEAESPSKRNNSVGSNKKSGNISAASSDSGAPTKRPRGRPPLTVKIKTSAVKATFSSAAKIAATSSKASLKSSTSSSKFGANNFSSSSSQSGKSSRATEHNAKSGALSLSSKLASTAGKYSDATPTAIDERESGKQTRPPASLVTQKVICVLMADGALGVADLCSRIGDATPKDLVQSVLDMLHVMGIVQQLKPTSGPPTTVYSLTGFARGSEAVDIHRLAEVTMQKRKNAAAIQKRISQLQAISFPEDSGVPQRQAILSAAIEDLTDEDNALKIDPLYRVLAEAVASKPSNSRGHR